jgi:hypothetical protein
VADYRTPEFRDLLSDFGSDVNRLARRAYLSYKQDPKSVSFEHRGYIRQDGAKCAVYKANVTGAYRALCYKKGNDLIWFWFGTHQDYDRLLKPLRK